MVDSIFITRVESGLLHVETIMFKMQNLNCHSNTGPSATFVPSSMNIYLYIYYYVVAVFTIQ